jgi:hypothetical protein
MMMIVIIIKLTIVLRAPFTSGPVRQIGAFAPVRQPIRTCMVKTDESHVSRVAVASPLS